MGCEKYDGEGDDIAVGKRLKFPKKFFDECNGVDHASVPRKLRSATKKRSQQSITPPLPVFKKLNHMFDGADTQMKDVNKSKLYSTCRSSNRRGKELVGPITKDEEEVAETLYALAGMIPDNGTTGESKLNKQPSDVKTLASPAAESSANANHKVVKEQQEIKTTSSQLNDEASKQLPNVAISAGEATKSRSFEDASRCDTFIKTVQLEISPQPVVACGYQANQQNMLKEKRNNGSLLWPGFSTVGLSCSDTVGSSPQFPIAKFPAWFGSTGSDAQAQNEKTCPPIEKDSQAPHDLTKPRKRCAAHVYISRLIKDLKTVSSHISESSSHDGLKQGTQIIQNGLTGKVNNMHGIVSSDGIACCTSEKNPTEVRNAILLHKRLLQDQQQGSTTSGFNSLVKKQNIEFLSLSAGSYVIKGTNGANIARHNLVAPSNSQNHPPPHFLMPQNGYSAATFLRHPSQQVLLPPYLGGASTHLSLEAAMALPRHPSHQNELQHASSAAHFTAQYKFGVTSQIRDWQNLGQSIPILRPPVQSTCSSFSLEPVSSKYYPALLNEHELGQFATSSSFSMEPLSSKYSPALLNEHELMSVSTTMIRGQYYNFPSGLEGNGHGHGLYTNNVPPLQQLLCSDHW